MLIQITLVVIIAAIAAALHGTRFAYELVQVNAAFCGSYQLLLAATLAKTIRAGWVWLTPRGKLVSSSVICLFTHKLESIRSQGLIVHIIMPRFPKMRLHNDTIEVNNEQAWFSLHSRLANQCRCQTLRVSRQWCMSDSVAMTNVIGGSQSSFPLAAPCSRILTVAEMQKA